MSRLLLSLAVTLLPLSLLPLSAAPPTPGEIVTQSASFPGDSGSPTEMSWLTWVPKGEKPKEGWPLLVFLHGAGERGSDPELVKKHGPPRLAGKSKEMDSFYMIAPQCPAGRWWDIQAVKALIARTVADAPVDSKRIYITGISMGGYGTWALLKDSPSLMAAAVPICGAGDPSSVAAFSKVPVWAFHGDKDEAVPVKGSIDMVEALKKEKGNVKLTIYPGVGHDSWTRTYENPELYSWLLSQHK